MGETEEFAEALLDQIAVELDEEKEIADLSNKITEDKNFPQKFTNMEDFSTQNLSIMSEKVYGFTDLEVDSNIKIEFPDLKEFKLLKGKKVYATNQSKQFVDNLFSAVADENVEKISSLIQENTAKFLVYSTYAKSYISKISTTYGDYLDSTVFLNKFILSKYPQIILYKQGPPFESNLEKVDSGYRGALKMTLLEELIHSTQTNLESENRDAAVNVNAINEELANIILELNDSSASELYEYLQLQTVPDDFPIAKKANLFFMLNPDNFVVNVLGPDVMTYSKVEIDPKISDIVPALSDIYQRWLSPIQNHHAAFSTMEGIAEFVVQNVLKDDDDFQNYLTTFMGRDLTEKVFDKFGKDGFKFLIEAPPGTREIKDPELYLKRDLSTGSKGM